MRRLLPRLAVLAAFALLAATPAFAQISGFESSGFGSLGTASVPMGGFSRGLAAFDPSRLSVSTSVTVGGGFGGTQGLQVTRLGYQFRGPIAMSVGVGNRFGGPGQMSPFLESFALRYQPSRSTTFQFEFRDVRSPLQLSSASDPFRRNDWWGY